MKKRNLKEITLRSRGQYHYTGKRIPVCDGYVFFVGLVKAVCKNDHEGVNSNRFWGRLKDEVEKKDYTYIDEELYVSAAVIEKMTNSNATRCEKTWGFFRSDGLRYLLEDLGYSKLKRSADKPTPSSTGAGPSASKKGKHKVSSPSGDIEFNDTQDFMSTTRALLRQREKSLNDREELLNQRSSLLSTREKECGEKEELLEKKLVGLNEREKRLNKQQQQSTVPELSEFMQKVSSLANQFKAKAARSRRNSSEEPVAAPSTTPSVSDDKGEEENNSLKTPVQQKDGGDHSRTPSRSPSPIRGSNPSSPEVRTCIIVHIIKIVFNCINLITYCLLLTVCF